MPVTKRERENIQGDCVINTLITDRFNKRCGQQLGTESRPLNRWVADRTSRFNSGHFN